MASYNNPVIITTTIFIIILFFLSSIVFVIIIIIVIVVVVVIITCARSTPWSALIFKNWMMSPSSCVCSLTSTSFVSLTISVYICSTSYSYRWWLSYYQWSWWLSRQWMCWWRLWWQWRRPRWCRRWQKLVRGLINKPIRSLNIRHPCCALWDLCWSSPQLTWNILKIIFPYYFDNSLRLKIKT